MAEWKVSEYYEPEKLNINQWDEADRPREKLMKHGAQSLSDAELLAILIGSGTPKETAVDLMKKVLKDCDNSLRELGQRDIEQLMVYNGIGEAKAITILAACELGRRRANEAGMQIDDLSSSQAIYERMRVHAVDQPNEKAWVLLLNNNFKLIREKEISEGGYTETAVDVRIVMREALLAKATVLVLVHNHPSNNPHPSRNDDGLTKQISDACKLMRLHFADHVIITDGGYYSYRDKGKL